jgi:hypothetical protein
MKISICVKKLKNCKEKKKIINKLQTALTTLVKYQKGPKDAKYSHYCVSSA